MAALPRLAESTTARRSGRRAAPAACPDCRSLRLTLLSEDAQALLMDQLAACAPRWQEYDLPYVPFFWSDSDPLRRVGQVCRELTRRRGEAWAMDVARDLLNALAFCASPEAASGGPRCGSLLAQPLPGPYQPAGSGYAPFL